MLYFFVFLCKSLSDDKAHKATFIFSDFYDILLLNGDSVYFLTLLIIKIIQMKNFFVYDFKVN